MSCVEKVRDNAGYWSDNSSRCSKETMVILESIAICFDELIAEIRAIREAKESQDSLDFMVDLYKESK